ncbi:MAG: hypothetical protein II261_04260, partial [Bacteroidaceae bacterium]|nr:hypothetical protein [Bacteroidaceae bacterium]
ISSGRKWLLEARHGFFSGSLWEKCPQRGDSGGGKWPGELRSVPRERPKTLLAELDSVPFYYMDDPQRSS